MVTNKLTYNRYLTRDHNFRSYTATSGWVYSGNGIAYINEITPCRTGLDTGWHLQVYHLGIALAIHGLLSLAIPPWVGAMSTAIVYAAAREETTSSA